MLQKTSVLFQTLITISEELKLSFFYVVMKLHPDTLCKQQKQCWWKSHHLLSRGVITTDYHVVTLD